MYKVGIIVASDKGYTKDRLDRSGEVIREILENTYEIVEKIILPDDEAILANAMIKWCDEDYVDLIVTTGGTGFSPRDVTPEATRKVVDRLVPGFSEVIRLRSLELTEKAMLSRGISGIRKNTLIINLPGSPKACRESLGFIMTALEHGLKILKADEAECAR